MSETFEVVTAVGALNAVAAGPENGRSVLLLHGFPETSAEWEHQLGTLADAGHRAVAVDGRGYSPGVRPADVSAYHRSELVADVVRIADALGWDRFDLVGHDWGAVVAWDAAITRPDRVRTLTAVSVPHPAPFAAALAEDEDQQRRSAYIPFLRRDDAAALLLEDDARRLRAMYGGSVPQEHVDAYVARLAQPGALDAALNWYRALDSEGPRGPVTVPTLYVWSDGDIALGPTAAHATADHVTGPYRFVELPGVSHWIPEEAAEALSGVLVEHLAAHPG